MKSLLAALLGLALLVPGTAPARAAENAAQPQAHARRQAQKPLRFTNHARARMSERGVSEAQVREIIAAGESFAYFHAGKWKTGYYESRKRLFIATDGPVVITVIADAGRPYVEGLKRNKP